MAENVLSWILDKGASILSDDKEDKSDVLLNAIKDGDLNIVTLLIGVVSDMNKMKFEGESLLSVAVFSGHASIVKLVVSKGADIEGIDDDGLTSLHVACREGHLEIVKFLASKGGDINRQTFDGMTPFAMATKRGHVDVLKYLISKGVEIERPDKKGKTPLIWASARGHLSTVNYLLKVGANVNGADKRGWTSLHFSINYDRLDVTKSLVSARADINWPDKRRDNAASHCFCWRSSQRRPFDFTGKKGGELVNRPNARGETPLHVATANGFTSIIDILVSQGGDLNAQTNERQTCLHLAAKLCKGSTDVEVTKELSKLMAGNSKDALGPGQALMKRLITKGADVNIADKAKKKPLEYLSGEMANLVVSQPLKESHALGARRTGSVSDNVDDIKGSKVVSKTHPEKGAPGPARSSSAIPEKVILRLSDKIPNDKVLTLGINLGLEQAAVARYEATNVKGTEVTSIGTRAMLFAWSNGTKGDKAIPTLKEALEESDLAWLAEKYL